MIFMIVWKKRQRNVYSERLRRRIVVSKPPKPQSEKVAKLGSSHHEIIQSTISRPRMEQNIVSDGPTMIKNCRADDSINCNLRHGRRRKSTGEPVRLGNALATLRSATMHA